MSKVKILEYCNAINLFRKRISTNTLYYNSVLFFDDVGIGNLSIFMSENEPKVLTSTFMLALKIERSKESINFIIPIQVFLSFSHLVLD